MRWPTFWEVFWFLALLVAQVIGGAVGAGLRDWFGIGAWVIVVGALLGLVGLFTVVWLMVRRDNRRRGQT